MLSSAPQSIGFWQPFQLTRSHAIPNLQPTGWVDRTKDSTTVYVERWRNNLTIVSDSSPTGNNARFSNRRCQYERSERIPSLDDPPSVRSYLGCFYLFHPIFNFCLDWFGAQLRAHTTCRFRGKRMQRASDWVPSPNSDDHIIAHTPSAQSTRSHFWLAVISRWDISFDLVCEPLQVIQCDISNSPQILIILILQAIEYLN